MAKRFIMIGGALILLLVFSEFLLPSAISDVVATAMKNVTSADQVNAKVEKSPAIMMLAGNFDAITVKVKNAKTDQVVFDEFDVTLQNAQVDMANLIQKRNLTMKSVEDVTIKAIVLEDELARAMNQSVKGIKNAKVSITPGKVTATGSFSMGGFINAKIILEGNIITTDQKIVFHAEHFQIDNSMVGKFGGTLVTDLTLVDLKKLPFDVTVKNVTLEEGKAVVYADSHR